MATAVSVLKKADRQGIAPGSPEIAKTILENVTEIVPRLRDRAQQTECDRRVSTESIRELDEAGVFRMTTPVEYGGYASLPSQIAPVFAEIARGCGSTGWVAWVTATGAQWMTAYPHQFQAELFAPGWVGPLQSGAMNKMGPGVGRRVPGGLMIKGKWPWASGCHHTRSHTMGVLVANDDGTKEPMICQVPHEEVEILDDWFVMGMQGSGSNTITVAEEIFVPEHRIVKTADLFAGNRPAPQPAGILYKINLIQFTSGSVAALAIGLARAAIEELQRKVTGKPITFTDYPDQMKAPVMHMQLAEMWAKLNACEAIAERSFARMEADAEQGVAATPMANAKIRTSSAYICTLAKQIADTAIRAGGASSIALTSPLQRIMRDVTTLSIHGQMNIETAYEDLGRTLAGMPGFGGPPKKPA